MKRPYVINLLLLLAALLLSVAVGSVDISLGSLVRILGARLGFAGTADWPKAYEVILFSLRLPHTALIKACSATRWLIPT
jgi:ABC-type Fe3+-siderophore transport system permease subunit